MDLVRKMSGSASSKSTTPETVSMQTAFEVEEEQVLKGVALIYSDKLNDAEEYFDTLRAGHARFSLHHAEVATFLALMSFDEDDLAFATSLLQTTEALAAEQELKSGEQNAPPLFQVKRRYHKLQQNHWMSLMGFIEEVEYLLPAVNALNGPRLVHIKHTAISLQNHEQSWKRIRTQHILMWYLEYRELRKYRTHSNIRKMNETVNTVKSWALGKAAAVLEKSGFEKAAALGDKLKPKEEPPEVKMAITREETNTNHKTRRTRLWCLYLQAECFLFIGLLNVVAGGEKWASMVKVGYNLKRAWVLYKQCKKKLQQLHREWVVMGGSLQGELSGTFRVNYDSDEEDLDTGVGTSAASSQDLQQRAAEGWETRKRRESDPSMVELGALAASGNLQKLEGDIKEDQELASLRIGIEFGMGAFNLIVSLIPANYHKALEILGMPGDRARAAILLQRAAATHHARAPLAALFLLQYHTVIMGLLPRTRNHFESAEMLLKGMAPTWKEGSIFRVLESRLARYEGNLQNAIKLLSDHPMDTTLRGNNMRLRNLMVDELGWCLMLNGQYDKAAPCFDSVLKETVWFKPYYGCLKSVCLWESGEPLLQQEGARIFQDMTLLMEGKKETALSPMELYGNRISSDFTTLGLAPLHPALELVAVYNGFQQMNKERLETLMAQIESQIHRNSKRTSLFQGPNKVWVTQGHTPQEIEPNSSDAPQNRSSVSPEKRKLSPAMATDPQPVSMRRNSSPRGNTSLALSTNSAAVSISALEHKWISTSLVTCRYLLALCMLNLGAAKAAEEHLRYVVAATDAPADSKDRILPTALGNVAAYARYELGSLLLDRDASGDGLRLLEKSITFPIHEFQTRLKFVVGERLKRFH